MKKLIIILLLFLTSCTSWNRTDKTLMASYLVLLGVDALQTAQANEELNPLLRKSDGSPDMAKVMAVKVVSGAAVYFLADTFPKYRTPFLWGVTALQGGAVIYNIGVAW